MDSCIVHIDLDSFFVSVERLHDKSLYGKPVIIGGKERGVVASCSYEARAYGIHSAMPIVQAKKLCPHAHFMQGTSGLYSKYSSLVTEIIAAKAPLFQKSSIDEFYLDLSGMDKYIGAYQWATELREQIIKETGLPISFGMSVNKLVAKIATGFAKPNGQKKVEQDEIQSFLDPLSIKKIPGVGKISAQALQKIGIEKIFQLRQLDKDQLFQRFGKYGIALFYKSRGICESEIIPHRDAKSVSTEITFGHDTVNLNKISVYLTAMVSKLCFRMRKKGFFSNQVSVKIRYANFHTVSKQTVIDNNADDRTFTLAVRKLFQELYDNHSKIRLVGVRFGNLNQNGSQLNIFDDHAKRMKVHSCMDDIRSKFGETKIVPAAVIDNNISRRFKP